GSKVLVRWHREQFSAVARNCRRDGRDFLLGVRREQAAGSMPRSPSLHASPSVQSAAPAEPEAPRVPGRDYPPLQKTNVERAPTKQSFDRHPSVIASTLPVPGPAPMAAIVSAVASD